MLFLHTYGRDIKWNPHIHSLICEGYFDKFNKYHKYEYFPYIKLRKSFMFELHKSMKKYIKYYKSEYEYSKFCKLIKWLEKKYPQGYYAYGPKINKKYDHHLSVKQLTNYIARYASHPAIAESRILELDLSNHMVKYYYDPHEDDVLDEDDPNRLGRQYVYESVFKFMKKLVRHIPNKGFHNIRYYGFYSKRSTIDTSSIHPLYSTCELKKIKQNINWNKKMKLTYGYEPLLCSCGKRMEICYNLCFFPPPKGPKQLSIDDFDLYEELSNKLIDYPERKIDIEKTFDLLPDFEKREALIYAENNLFKETIILKCMNCDYEEEVDYEIVEECWMDGPYPISYCPHCNVGDFVPLDIYNKKKLK